MKFLALVAVLSVVLIVAPEGIRSDLLESIYLLGGNPFDFYGTGPSINLLIYGIVAELIEEIPANELYIYFLDGSQVYKGNQLNITQVECQPSIQILLDNPRLLYTLAMVDMDQSQPNFRELQNYIQWLVIDIPGEDLQAGRVTGKTLLPYLGPKPVRGNHRIAFALIPQPYGTYTPKAGTPPRENFCLRVYQSQNDLARVIAANFFMCQASGT